VTDQERDEALCLCDCCGQVAEEDDMEECVDCGADCCFHCMRNGDLCKDCAAFG
jgi:hypothetical protein